MHYFHHHRNGDILVREPLILGHESAGIIVAVGSNVTGFEVGERVALEVGQPCGRCDRCQEGRYNICKGMRFRSSAKSFPHYQGTLQERINHPAAWCHKSVSSFTYITSFLGTVEANSTCAQPGFIKTFRWIWGLFSNRSVWPFTRYADLNSLPRVLPWYSALVQWACSALQWQKHPAQHM